MIDPEEERMEEVEKMKGVMKEKETIYQMFHFSVLLERLVTDALEMSLLV